MQWMRTVNENTATIFAKEKSLFSRLNEKSYKICRNQNENEQQDKHEPRMLFLSVQFIRVRSMLEILLLVRREIPLVQVDFRFLHALGCTISASVI